MSRQRADREDLMAEAITLSPRVQFLVPGFPEEIVAGKRSDGRWSVFFGGDPVYHFDATGHLRRAFLDDQLYRSQETTLSQLTRQETADQTILLRHDLSELEMAAFRQELLASFKRLQQAILSGQTTLQKSVPPESDFRSELAGLIQQVLDEGCRLSAPLTTRK